MAALLLVAPSTNGFVSWLELRPLPARLPTCCRPACLIGIHPPACPCPRPSSPCLQLKSIKKELGLEKDEKTALVQK